MPKEVALVFLSIAVGFIVLVALLVFYIRNAGKRQADGLARWAGARQWAFSTVAPKALTDGLGSMAYFADAQNTGNSTVLSGRASGKDIHIFYHVIHGPSDEDTATMSVFGAVYMSGDIPCPQFSLRRKKLLQWMPHFDFATHGAFNQKWCLHGPDEPAIRKWFSHELLTYFASSEADIVVGEGGRLVYMRQGGRWLQPKNVDGFLQEALALDEVLRKRAHTH